MRGWEEEASNPGQFIASGAAWRNGRTGSERSKGRLMYVSREGKPIRWSEHLGQNSIYKHM
jgi:hypothetical protein